MQKKYINKKFINNGLVIQFLYCARISDSKIDISDKMKTIDNIFNNFYSRDIVEIVEVIRTVFKDFKEEFLDIYLSNDNGKVYAKFYDTKLILYSEERKINDLDLILLKYSRGKNFDFSITRNPKTVNEFNTSDLVEPFEKFIHTIESLNNTSIINLNLNDELLCKIYKEFYEEDPDFSEKNTNIKFQTMFTILSQFIPLPLDYSMSVYNDGKMPINLELSEKIRNLRALGKVNVSKLKNIKLEDNIKNDIKNIGKIIRENDPDMITLSKIIHAGNYNLCEKSNYGYILKSTKCTDEQVKDTISLVKKINNSLE